MSEHITVMLSESIAQFEEKKIRCFFDGTLGAGGFAKALLQAHPEIEVYIGCDQDLSALEIAKQRLEAFEQVVYVHDNFSNIASIVEENGIEQLDGVFFDLGVSSMQLDQRERGFSFMKDGPLDMRMDQDGQGSSAKEWVNTASEKELARVFFEYGEERSSRKLAKAIVAKRKSVPFETTKQLADFVEEILGKNYGKKHRATQVFQALRMWVNQEMSHVEKGIKEGLNVLAPEGRMGVISFHSLEDRLVKNILGQASKKLIKIVGAKEKILQPLVKLVTKKPLVPSRKEVEENRRCRSAKLRVAERL